MSALRLCLPLLALCLLPLYAADPPLRTSFEHTEDLFARLRSDRWTPQRDHWQRVGLALARLETLDGATYEPQTGALLLIGKPVAQGIGPFHLDDLMVALQAALFHKEDLGMTIDPDPDNPHGPEMVVRYFGGCENTAFGWVMFECDRLLKCYSQGQDNFTKAELKPDVPDFYNMLQRYLAAGQGRDASQWNRFWLAQDIHDKPRGEAPKSSNGTQPIAMIAHEGESLSFLHGRVYLRTQPMVMRGGKLEDAQGAKDQQAEQFAIHFCNHYDEFARVEPAFAQLEALSRLVSLADWIVAKRIPIDTELIRTYRQQIAVITPTRTSAHTASLKHPQGELQLYGGVDLGSRTFYGQDDGRTAKLADPARASEPQHRGDVGWPIQGGGELQTIVAVPTLATQLAANPKRKKQGIEFQPPDDTQPEVALPPEPQSLAQSDRRVPVARLPASLAGLQFFREQLARGPPDAPLADGVPLLDGTELAKSDRATKISRELMPLATLLAITSNQQSPRPPPSDLDTEPASAEPGFQAESDRTLQMLARLDMPLISSPQRQAEQARGPPTLALDQRLSRVPREAIPLKPAAAGSSLGLEVFETADGQRTYNLPKLETWNHPRSEQRASVQGVPGTEIRVADRLTLVSELGDVMIPFATPVIDQARAVLYYPTMPAGLHGIRGYYPQAGAIEFDDGMKLTFDSSGRLEQFRSADGTSVRFRYARGKGEVGSAPQACEVSSVSTTARSGIYDLLDRASSQPVAKPQPARKPESPRGSDVATVAPPREPLEQETKSKPAQPPATVVPSDASSFRLETSPSPEQASLVYVTAPENGVQQTATSVRFVSADAAFTWRAALRDASASSSSPSISLRTGDGQSLEMRLPLTAGTADAGQPVELPLMVGASAEDRSELPNAMNVYVDIDVEWQTQAGPQTRRISVPLRFETQRHGSPFSAAVLVALVGALGIGIWRILGKR